MHGSPRHGSARRWQRVALRPLAAGRHGGGARARHTARYRSTMASKSEVLQVAGREVTITNPDKVFFTELGVTKIELVRYYLPIAHRALCGAGGRPMALKRFVN